MSGPGSRGRAFALVTLSYVLGTLAAVATVRWAGPHLPGGTLGAAFAADVVATGVVFAFSVAFDNSSFYDPYWSVAPPVLAAWLVTLSPAGNVARQAIVLLAVFAWGIRLTWNWARGWTGLAHEDWRYVRIRAQTGRGYWPASFGGIHLFPTVLVFLGCVPLWTSLSSPAPLGPLDLIAGVITLGAITIETVADEQLRRFVLSRPPAGTVLRDGLWRYARHPNYFGELSFWWGLAAFGAAAGAATSPWTFAGALAMTLLFVFVSGPLLDRRSLERRPGYAEHVRRTSMLVPWPPRDELRLVQSSLASAHRLQRQPRQPSRQLRHGSSRSGCRRKPDRGGPSRREARGARATMPFHPASV